MQNIRGENANGLLVTHFVHVMNIMLLRRSVHAKYFLDLEIKATMATSISKGGIIFTASICEETSSGHKKKQV